MKKNLILFLAIPVSITLLLANQIVSAELVPVVFDSHGSTLRGFFSAAVGKGPHPTMILLHGSPGGKGDVFGLAEAAPEAGWNALVFNYRGYYESEGMGTLKNSLEDVFSALDFLKSDEMISEYGVDPDHIALAGYSYGGGMALTAAARDSSIQYVISIAAADIGTIADQAKENEKFRAMFVETIDSRISRGLIKGPGGEEALKELLAIGEKYDLVRNAEYLSKKSLLVIGGWKDQASTLEEHVFPLIRALQDYGAKKVDKVILDTDHAFSGSRAELRDVVVSWLKNQHPRKK